MQTDTQTHVQHKAHMDSRPYEVANKESAEKAKAKLKARIEEGRKMQITALKSVESDRPRDLLVPSEMLMFDASGEHLKVGVRYADKKKETEFLRFHPHAFGQLVSRVDIPKKYADRLVKEDLPLLGTNLNSRYHRARKGKKYLVRAIGSEIRGWLSDSYGRYDVAPMVEGFLAACAEYDAVPVEAANLDTRFFMKMLLPCIFEPVPNEILAVGVRFRSSDYGDGLYEVRGFISRTWCTNDHMTEDCLKKVHLGPKLTEETFSQETLTHQTEMLISATKDTVRSILKPENIERCMKVIQEADSKQVKIADTIHRLRSTSDLTKEESDRVNEILTVVDTEVLPPVQHTPKKGHTSLYRFANAISAMANEDEVEETRKMDLEVLAGRLMGFK